MDASSSSVAAVFRGIRTRNDVFIEAVPHQAPGDQNALERPENVHARGPCCAYLKLHEAKSDYEHVLRFSVRRLVN